MVGQLDPSSHLGGLCDACDDSSCVSVGGAGVGGGDCSHPMWYPLLTMKTRMLMRCAF